MKIFLKHFILLIISVLYSYTNAQAYIDTVDGEIIYLEDFPEPSNGDEDPPFMFVEEMPEFPGGPDSLNAFLAREIQYPPIAKSNGITGTVLIEFVVERDGKVTNGRVKVPLFPDCDVEALRGVMSMPNWKPGKNMGRPVRCYYQVPVTFRN